LIAQRFAQIASFFSCILLCAVVSHAQVDVKKSEADKIEALARCLADAKDEDICKTANEAITPKPEFFTSIELPTLESIDDDIDLSAIKIEPEEIVTSAVTKIEDEEVASVDIVIEFDFNSAQIRADEKEKLETLAQALQTKILASKKFAIIGHTDNVGEIWYNCALSTRRAKAVANRLIRLGAAPNQLLPIGAGEYILKNENNGESAENRRVGFITQSDENANAISKFRGLC